MSWLKNLMLGSDSRRKKGTEGPTPVAEGDFKKMDSGLQYCDLKTGEGASPAKGKRVTVHYTGWLTNGKRFDSSVAKQKPFTFEIGKRRVIKGWDEGVRSMKTGGIRQLKVPSNLGYGSVGSPPLIPANATLIFEIELLSIA